MLLRVSTRTKTWKYSTYGLMWEHLKNQLPYVVKLSWSKLTSYNMQKLSVIKIINPTNMIIWQRKPESFRIESRLSQNLTLFCSQLLLSVNESFCTWLHDFSSGCVRQSPGHISHLKSCIFKISHISNIFDRPNSGSKIFWEILNLSEKKLDQIKVIYFHFSILVDALSSLNVMRSMKRDLKLANVNFEIVKYVVDNCLTNI